MGASADRSRRLLEAGMALSSELSLAAVLQRVVELAAELTGAQYAALGVIDIQGHGLSDFVTTGLDDAAKAAIGALPRGRGLLGALIDDARTLRLRDIEKDRRSVGFPANHPSMHSFLGTPVTAHNQVFGNLYLTNKQGAAEFSGEDEDTVRVLAGQAGIAVSNARLYEEARSRQRWLDALREITIAILANSSADDVLALVSSAGRALTDADTACAVLPDVTGELSIRAAVGVHADDLRGMPIPVQQSLSGDVIRGGKPIRVDDAAGDRRAYPEMVTAAGMGPAIFVPLAAHGGAFGTLSASRLQGKPPFTAEHVALLVSFAEQAALAIEYGRAQEDLRRLTTLEDRERIARDMHDGVIQRLFAVGLSLQATATRTADVATVARVEEAVKEIDQTIADLRSYIFGLRPSVLTGVTVSVALQQLAHEFEVQTSIVVALDVDPTLDEALSGAATHLLHLAREALSNLRRHAQATTVRVSLRRENSQALLEIDDDGVGFDVSRDGAGMGLANMRERAASINAEFAITSTPGQGTTVRVCIPLDTRHAKAVHKQAAASQPQ
ncbi:MAG: GAF domain-containing sensor histidine kinase [Candidatus Dormibacteraeota bacterium]|nr:GAF domain-containing sensor histidine kinase [Candidatus Dormibacteraeota bacterium]